ncbi:hypothetical protein DRW03_34015 [Corallococcus sp. H22C18031201]|uniref:PilZ domain-containing protein n=1 Tax=Citreicoccus inhibens TaxID=2849499 RepID=UPI000E71B783|nr:PilZ domain-containing protein [Citreicoccus inhibens]MBU8899185.1 PilZ domain-containing protein [Citreicoccus inhibens]RJS15258.1 hypothetical protein DRW03_34015 [Corallococcus sp. H22C18031201]
MPLPGAPWESSSARRASPPHVLLVEPASDRAARLTSLLQGTACTVVPGLEAARAAYDVFRPLMVLVGHAALTAENSPGFQCLRTHPTHGDVPLVVLADPEAPAQVLESSARSGADDCLLGPVRAAQLQARVRLLVGAPGATHSTAPGVLLVGEAAGTPHGLGAALELSGFHVVYAQTVEWATRLGTHPGAAPLQLIVVRAEGLALPEPVLTDRLRPLSQLSTPLLVWDSGDAGSILARVQAVLRRPLPDLRVHERVPFHCPVEFREPRGDGLWSASLAQELSPGGLFLRTLAPAPEGAALELRIHLPASRDAFEVSGVVAWANRPGPRRIHAYRMGMGVQFVGMSPRRRMQLKEICRTAAT